MNRRRFLQGSLLLMGLSGCRLSHRGAPTVGKQVGVDVASGHKLRDRTFPKEPARIRRVKVAILGGGIAGLTAAWKLHRSGFEDYQLFELEAQTGGNSRAVDYAESSAPWAAHYLPVPTIESKAVRELLREMKLMDESGALNTRHLCHAPEERIYDNGYWEAGLFPRFGAQPEDLEQLKDFEADIAGWQQYRDSAGRKAFAIPLAYSSDDPELMALDRISFAEYARRHGWTSKRMQWFLNYGCRDDYGASIEETSAWAGLHYHACRDGGGFEDPRALFVWPEGNAHIARHLRSYVKDKTQTRALVVKLEPGRGFDYLDLDSGERVGVEAEQVICSLPTYQRSRLLEDENWSEFVYSPWVTANLVLDRAPQDISRDPPLCWDNVIYGAKSLGFVVATHQSLEMDPHVPTVFTWYRPFAGEEPTEVRKRLLETTWEQWRDEILADLAPLYPDFEQRVKRVDVMVMGHAMIRPSVGFVSGRQRRQAAEPLDNIYFAHSDLSGISVFEEAQYQGVRAAEEVLAKRGISFISSL